MSGIYISNRRYRIEYKPEDYPNLDPVFIYNPDISGEERIRAMVEKLATLDDLPRELSPKEDFGIIPPLFYFGIPTTVQSFFDLAMKNDFDGYPEYRVEPAVRNPNLLQTRRRLRKKIYDTCKVNVFPDLHTVHLNASEQTDFLSFLSSYNGPYYALPPPELGKCIRSLLNIDYDLKWYLDSSKSDWHIGRLTVVNVGRIKQNW